MRDIGITHIRDLAKEYSKMEVFEIDDERQVQFYPVFTDDKIDELITEMQGLIKQAEDQKIELKDSDVENMLLLLCVKHFTHLKNRINDQLDYQLALYKDMLKSGLFKIIIQDVFPPVELHKVFVAFGELVGANMYLETIEETAQNYAQHLSFRNESVLFDLEQERKRKQNKAEQYAKEIEENLEKMDVRDQKKAEDESEDVIETP